jgi:hypothetical protein
MMMSGSKPITDVAELRVHLQFAVGLEWATIPLYLTALYSIPEGENSAATQVIQGVVIEEMLHMALAANVLNAIGGEPSTTTVADVPEDGVTSSPIPSFPGTIPFLPSLGQLHLRPFSPEALDTFLAIEHPAPPSAKKPKVGYGSIGAFYSAIIKALKNKRVCPDRVFKDAQKQRAGCQIQPEEFYGGASELLVVTNRDEAVKAINKIVEQGEGLPPGELEKKAADHGVVPNFAPPVQDGDQLPDRWKMYSHYARFNEIRTGRRYHPNQLIGQAPKGMLLPSDWNAVYPMAPDPDSSKYAATDVAAAVDSCNDTYTQLIEGLYAAFNGAPGKLREMVTVMWSLKYEVQALMKTPSPLKSEAGQSVGAPFEFQQRAR